MRGGTGIKAVFVLTALATAAPAEAAAIKDELQPLAVLAEQRDPDPVPVAPAESVAPTTVEPSRRPPEPERPALLSADEVVHDENLGIITARGNVEISHEDRLLLADTVSYNTRTKVVSASGNVSLLEPNGDVVFGEYMEMTEDLREGFIREVRAMLKDNTRLAATSGVRTGDNRMSYSRAVFSPCELCKDKPDQPPLWQIKSQRVVHNQDEKRIRYRNAWLEFAGIPVFYTPYFSHPDPTVERQSGFMSPTFGASETLGLLVQVPFYLVISPTSDMTFEPILTSKQGQVLAGEFRQELPYGEHRIEASGTLADRTETDGTVTDDVLRGHMKARGRYDLSDTWRGGFNFNRATDDTYLRLYNFSNDSRLTSNIFVEGLRGRSYAAANGYSYQGLRRIDRNVEKPVVLPKLDYNYVSEPWFADSRLSVDTGMTVLLRDEGRDTRRLSMKTSWELPYIDPIGGLYTLALSLRTDGYWTQQFVPGSDEVNPVEPTETKLAGRVFPQAALKWRYPWVSHGKGFDQVVEPLAQLVAGPSGGNSKDIPNEDSLDFEFDDTNLFSVNRFPGLDRVDPGQRVDYGLRWTGHADYGGNASMFIGQSYRLQKEEGLYPDNSGVQDRLSDVVGRVGFTPLNDIDLLYRFRLDKSDFSPRRHEVDLRLGPSALNLKMTYLFTDSETTTEDFGDREEVRLRVASQMSRYWSGFVSTRRDLQRDATLDAAVGIAYEDECFVIELVGRREFFVDREIENEDSIFLRVSFKYLGGVESTQTISGGPTE